MIPDFEQGLKEAMEHLLTEIANGERVTILRPKIKRSPFRGLIYFDYGDADSFFGRKDARLKVIEALYSQVQKNCAFVMTFGSSGLGKAPLSVQVSSRIYRSQMLNRTSRSAST